MTVYFVSNAGSNTAPYDTEAKAATSILTIAALPWLTTDVVKVSSTHTQTATGAITLTLPATPGLQILSVTFNGAGTGGLAAGGSLNVGAASAAFAILNSAYVYGLSMNSGTNNNTACDFNIGNNNTPQSLVLDTCTINTPSVNSGALLQIGAASNTSNDDNQITLVNCTRNSGNTGSIQIGYGRIRITNLTLTGTAPTILFSPVAAIAVDVVIDASNLSGVAWSNLVLASAASSGRFACFQCKMRASWTMTSGSFAGPGSYTVEAIDCESGDTQYAYNFACWQGTIRADATTFVNGGATDGTNPISFHMIGNANTSFVWPLTLPPIVWFNSTLSAMTTRVEVINGGTTYTDAQLWQETLAKVTSGSTMGTWNIADRAATILTAGSNQPTSSAVTWSSPPASPVQQYLESGSFTPAEVGEITVLVKLAANDDVWVSPKVLANSGKQWMTLGGVYVNEAAPATSAKVIGGYYG